MERQSGALLVDRPIADAGAEIEIIPSAARLPALQVWAWRAVVAIAVLVALVGMLAWSSSPPT